MRHQTKCEFGLFALGLLLLSVCASAATCGNLTDYNSIPSSPWTSVCINVLGYTSVTTGIVQQCAAGDDATVVTTLTAVSNMSLSCATAFTKYICSLAHPPCGAVTLPPQQLCDALQPGLTCAGQDQVIISVIKAQAQAAGKPFFTTNCSGTPSALYVYKNSTSNPGSSVLSKLDMQLPICQTYTGSVCASVVTYPVYVQGGNTSQLTTSESAVKSAEFLFTIVPPSCKDQLMQLLCTSAFPKCLNKGNMSTNYLQSLPFPQFPSIDFANSVKSACGLTSTGTPWLYLAITPATLSSSITVTRNCTLNATSGAYLPTVSTSIPRFPPSTGYVLSSYTIPPNTEYGLGVAPVSCPYPTVLPKDESVKKVLGSCAIVCPIPLYTRDQYLGVDVMMGLMSGLSLVLSSVLLCTYFCFARSRKRWYNVYFTGCLCMLTFSLFWTVAVKNPNNSYGVYQGMQCEDESKPVSDGYCLFQAIFLQYFAFAAVCWWCVQSIDLALQIVYRSSNWPEEKKKKLNLGFNLWSWGLPLIFTLVAIGEKKLGNASLGIAYCFITDENLSWGIFYAPVALMIVIGFVCMCISIGYIYRSSSRAGTHKRKGGYSIYIRPAIFVFFFMFVWICIFSYRARGHMKADEYTEAISNWVKCVLVDLPRGTVQSCKSEANPDLEPWYLIQFVAAGVGVWVFILYNTWENCVMWYHFIRCRAYNFSTTSGASDEDASSATSRAASRQGTGVRRDKSFGSNNNLIKSDDNPKEDASNRQLKYGGPASSATEHEVAIEMNVNKSSQTSAAAHGMPNASPRFEKLCSSSSSVSIPPTGQGANDE